MRSRKPGRGTLGAVALGAVALGATAREGAALVGRRVRRLGLALRGLAQVDDGGVGEGGAGRLVTRGGIGLGRGLVLLFVPESAQDAHGHLHVVTDAGRRLLTPVPGRAHPQPEVTWELRPGQQSLTLPTGGKGGKGGVRCPPAVRRPLAQGRLVGLADRVARQLVDQLDDLAAPRARPSARAPRRAPAPARRAAAAGHHEGRHRLAGHRVGHRPRRPRRRSPGGSRSISSTSAREDLGAAPVDHVLAAVEHRDEAVGVQARDVAGVEPAVDDRRRGRLRVAGVAGGDQRAAQPQLARARPRPATVPSSARTCASMHGSGRPTEPGPGRELVVEQDRRRRVGLGQPVDVEQPHAGQRLAQRGRQRAGNGAPPAASRRARAGLAAKPRARTASIHNDGTA